ncbi:unnamed protein product [Clonostachys rosea f. rosea IK726]|uniref:Uncharacterized protein n=1 Tax=Clonostachys rosea f. rosea IK726 TaxID=1349383 RepID=A0ACA9U807_BIOOC|nr:unnamed protein product [Clonostachys rosea f. rosea IK726]
MFLFSPFSRQIPKLIHDDVDGTAKPTRQLIFGLQEPTAAFREMVGHALTQDLTTLIVDD